MNRCVYHPEQTAVAVCSHCGRAICAYDTVQRGDRIFCMICSVLPAQPVQPPYPVYPQPVHYHTPTPPTNGLAIASLVTGVLSIFFGACYGSGIAFAIAALITGIIGMKQIKQNSYSAGSSLALTGIITGAVGILFGLLWILFYIFLGVAFSSSTLSNSGIIY